MDIYQEADMDNYIPAASIEALRQLVAINEGHGSSEVTEWLQSDEAEPVLKQILANVPCAPIMH